MRSQKPEREGRVAAFALTLRLLLPLSMAIRLRRPRYLLQVLPRQGSSAPQPAAPARTLAGAAG
jgi:hypothetical protein